MVKNYKISTPFFEFGPKAYLYGDKLLELMKKIDTYAEKYDMDVIADVQTTDLRLIAENTSDRIHVYSQHIQFLSAEEWEQFYPKQLRLQVQLV